MTPSDSLPTCNVSTCDGERLLDDVLCARCATLRDAWQATLVQLVKDERAKEAPRG